MSLSQINCKQIFKNAYENRYTWGKSFNGYQGKCSFTESNKVFEGDFSIGKDFKPLIKNISNQNVVKSISSQLFEVAIHRVKRDFNDVHANNDFDFVNETEKGIEMTVIGKNQGDRYRVKNNEINMVFRKIHGFIIHIYVEDFFETGAGYLSKVYTSQQLDIDNFSPKSPKYIYEDNFLNIKNLDIWALESRLIKFSDHNNSEVSNKFMFREISSI